jgi:hypothetical protein
VRALRKWKIGLAIAGLSFVVGSARLVATGDTGWLTWVWFVVAAVYAFAALVARRLLFPERAEDLLGHLERRPRFATLLQQADTVAATGDPSSGSNIEERIRYLQQGSDESVTRNRVTNAVMTLAALIGIVLVVTGAGQKSGGDDDNAPSTPPPTSQVAPAVPGAAQPGAPAQTQVPAPAPTQAPAQAPKKDNDGDDDG